MSGIKHLSQGIIEELGRRVPGRRKTRREKPGLPVAAMLDVRSANLMDSAASLPCAFARGEQGNPSLKEDRSKLFDVLFPPQSQI